MIRLLALAAACLVGACTQAESNGAKAAGDRPTIVSLNPCTDAILSEIATPEQLLAISHYSHDPASTSMDLAQARRYRAIGGTVEEVLALDPDLVIASSFIAPSTRQALEDLGIRVETFGIAANVAESRKQVRELAALAGNAEGGAALNRRIDAALEAAGGSAGARIGALLWQPGGIVAGQHSMVDELLVRTGFDNDVVRRGLGQADHVRLEEIVAHPPDLLLVAGSETGQHHPLLKRLPEMRRAEFDPSLLYCGGPTIIRAAQRLSAIRKQWQ